MIIGTPKEIKNHESRVGLNTASVGSLVDSGHKVYIEKNAGIKSGFSDDDYKKAGAEILSTAKEIYSKSELIVKVKEPQKEEFILIQKNQTLFTYFHFSSSKSLTEAMMKSKATCIAYETVETGDKKLPLLTPMSEVAGRMAVQQGAKYLEKPQLGKGKLIGGVPGVAPAKVIIIGAGIVGTEAAKMAAGLGAQVILFDINLDRLRYLSEVLPKNVIPLYSSREAIINHLSTCDVIIGSVLVPGAKAPKIITKNMLDKMESGTVLVDVAVDQGGCFETCRETTHQEPVYLIDGKVHYCVTNIPGAVPMTSTNALNNATLSYIQLIANIGWEKACKKNQALNKGLNMHDGKIVYKAVADTFGYEYFENNF
ncbi:MAG: alanine dehydrogenase [Flavobacteriales bacterium]|nr:MAG: alanine dehydrogenase [Flavobacteriales bacterium]